MFAVSLLMLWDGWLRHTGQPSLFAPAPAASEGAQAASGSASGSTHLPQPSAQLTGGAAPAAVAAAGSAPEATAKGERITLASVFALGMLSSTVAVRTVARMPLLASLRAK